MADITFRSFDASDVPWLVEQHRVLYARDEGFDDSFGAVVDEVLQDFMARSDPTCDRGWIAMAGAQRVGSIFCVRLDKTTAKLRLFLTTSAVRGTGLGQKLLDLCMDHAKACGFAGMELWTHESHTAACALYLKNGWTCVDSRPVRSFGVDLVEQTWKIRF